MIFKRVFDIFFSVVGLLTLSPVLILAALLVRLSSEGPILFTQMRVGRSGILFKIYKLRTMHIGHNGSTISVKGEKRITPIGATLRRLKIDELPELWNILIGDMSFVGPRPDMPEYAERLQDERETILTLRPGLTSPASIKYAREEELLSAAPDPHKYFDEVIWPDKVRMNLEYVRNRSFMGDVLLIFRTLFNIREIY